MNTPKNRTHRLERLEMNSTQTQTHRRPVLIVATSLALTASVVLLALGCNRGSDTSSGGTKIKVCYLGLTCEPPIFVAYEKGFFEEEGLDVELVKSDWDSMRDGLGLGTFQ